MDDQQFDNLVKSLATRLSRRGILPTLAAGAIAVVRHAPSAAQPGCREEGRPCGGNQVCCEGLICGPGGQGSTDRCTMPRGEAPAPASTAAVVTTLPYRVEVTCDYDSDVDQTSCVFVGTVEGETAPVTSVILPVSEVCDGVVDGDFIVVEPQQGGTGPTDEAYKSTSQDEEGRPRCTLVFTGRVVTVSTATYWCETESGIFPAEGQGLSCPQETPSDDISDTTGAILIHAFACPADAAGSDVDWFASCPTDPESAEFRIRAGGESESGETQTASTSGEEPARFELLQPGAYELDEVDGGWCHAESDNTNANGQVVVMAGQRTNVWIFHCPAGGTSGTS